MSDSDTSATCSVCSARPGTACRGVDHLPLPTVHPERTASTPLFDELQAALS